MIKHSHRSFGARTRQQHQEFFASITTNTVGMTKTLGQMVNAVANHFITRQMTMDVIDLFEVVYIDHGHSKISILSA